MLGQCAQSLNGAGHVCLRGNRCRSNHDFLSKKLVVLVMCMRRLARTRQCQLPGSTNCVRFVSIVALRACVICEHVRDWTGSDAASRGQVLGRAASDVLVARRDGDLGLVTSLPTVLQGGLVGRRSGACMCQCVMRVVCHVPSAYVCVLRRLALRGGCLPGRPKPSRLEATAEYMPRSGHIALVR